jgi:hypothetical protein
MTQHGPGASHGSAEGRLFSRDELRAMLQHWMVASDEIERESDAWWRWKVTPAAVAAEASVSQAARAS